MVTENELKTVQDDSEQKPPKKTKQDSSCLTKEVYVSTEKGLQRTTPFDIILDLMSRMKW